MRGKIGASTSTQYILPRHVSFRYTKELSKEAKRRLAIIDWYLQVSPKHSANGKRNATLTARHFAINRSYFYKWYGRFKKLGHAGLESKSCKPHKLREPKYTARFIALIRKIRKENPHFSAKKIYVIICRDYTLDYVPSAATIGRIIKKFKLFYKVKKRSANRANRGIRNSQKTRLPYRLRATNPHKIIEFDMKHIKLAGKKVYAFVAIDPVIKQIYIKISRVSSSDAAKKALEGVLKRFGRDEAIVNDNGSENMGAAFDFLRENKLVQYFTRPNEPTDKPFVENVIGKFQTEFLDYCDKFASIAKLQQETNMWVNDFHYFRPHQSLNYLTPGEFSGKMNIHIPLETEKVSSR